MLVLVRLRPAFFFYLYPPFLANIGTKAVLYRVGAETIVFSFSKKLRHRITRNQIILITQPYNIKNIRFLRIFITHANMIDFYFSNSFYKGSS